MAREFSRKESHDFTIQEDGRVVGHIRLKPNAVLWKQRDRGHWHRVRLDDFAAWIIQNGTEVNQ